MRVFISLIILSSVTCSGPSTINPSHITIDTLKKYSYVILGYSKGKLNGNSGTGFFLSYNNKSYLVTNYHVFSGYDPITKSHNSFNDSISVMVNYNSIRVQVFFKVARDTILEKKIYELDSPDLKILLIKNPSIDLPPNGIYYIKDFFDETLFGRIPDSLFSYGYPSNTISLRYESPVHFSSTAFTKSDSTLTNLIVTQTRPANMNDSLFFKKFNSIYSIIPNFENLPGKSGSPIFGIFKNDGGKSKVFSLYGILRGGDDRKGTSQIIKANNISKSILENQQ